MSKSILKGIGEKCPKCGILMQRYTHTADIRKQLKQVCYYTEWDKCYPCRHLQHYEKYKIYNKMEFLDYSKRVEEFARQQQHLFTI